MRVGLTTYGRNEEGRFTLPGEYVDCVRRAGATPFLLAHGGPDRVDDWLDVLDAVILTGGGDIDPARYGATTHPAVYMVDEERDDSELAIAERLLERGTPTLGICRGAQVLNVARGGTLHVHLPDVVGESIQHRSPPREPTPHPLTVEVGTRLSEILGAQALVASSWHHQAIRDVGRGLQVNALAADGTIEGVEVPNHPWCVAVQWHPELTAAVQPEQQRLFDALVEAAKGTKR